jgi:hypothetical protein
VTLHFGFEFTLPFTHTVIEVANSDKDSLQQEKRIGELMVTQRWSKVFASRKTVQLKNLLRSVKAISLLKGKVASLVPTGVARFTFDELETGI